MIGLTPELWRRIEPLLDQALDLDGPARAAFLDRACAADTDVRAAVEALLRADERAGEFLQSPGGIGATAFLPADDLVPADVSAHEGERIGPFRVVRELAAGGMGAVYLAERADGQFEQRVALKLIRRSLVGEVMRHRFLAERQILARLQHANIAFLLDGGVTADGLPWYAMEYVEGVPITRYCDDHGLGCEDRLRLFAKVCAAVEYAHAHHVVHRDLKPANILVTSSGELKLIDFGIARVVDDHTDATPAVAMLAGSRALTPDYAAPEQIRGEQATAATDVYALGVVLYELLCGRRPYRVTGHSPAELERLIADDDIAAPSTVNRTISKDLDHIVLRAMQRAPDARYPTVAELAHDVARYLDRGPVLARKGAVPYRVRRLIHGHRRAVAGLVVGAVLVGTASASVVRRPAGSGGGGAAAGGGTTSAVAQRLYDEGLRAYHHVDLHAARRFFRAAVEADTTFAAAAYYAITTERSLELVPDSQLQARLRRLSARLPDHERLLLQSRIAWSTADPVLLAIADTLVTRYRDEPRSHLLMGRALAAVGEPFRGLHHLHRAVRLETPRLREATPECTACEAFDAMISAFLGLDSLGAAERTARDWIRREPASGRGWFWLAGILDGLERGDEALQAVRQVALLAPGNPYVPIFPALVDIRSGDFESADRLLREQARAGPPAVQLEALWFLTISLRYQGRLHDALETVRLLRRLHPERSEPRIAEALVLLEMGRARAAAARFDSIAALPGRGDFERVPSLHAKIRSWSLVHLATAYAAAGDTAKLLPLADTIQTLGARTLGALYRNSHHHVRGLLLAARGQHAEAAEQYRRAVLHPITPISGYTRTNLELARVLLELGEPEQAVRTLQPALRRGLESAGLYATRSELQELLGYAFEAAGQPDSARAYYARVLAAWQNADPEFDRRRRDVRLRLERMQ